MIRPSSLGARHSQRSVYIPCLLWGVLAVAGCNKDEGKDKPAPVEVAGCTSLTWERDIKPFFSNWCAPCHSPTVVGADRQGAPEGVDLDTLEAVRLWAPRVTATALSDTTTMPPAGGTTAKERAMVTEWIGCDLPGIAEPPKAPTCDDAEVVSQTLAVQSQSDADALCASGPFVDIQGDVTVSADVRVDCLCHVTGDVNITGGALASPQLQQVDGDLQVTGAALGPDLPNLRTIQGQLWVHDAPTLTVFELPWLRTVGGGVIIENNANLERLQLQRLASSGVDARFEGLPALTSLESLESLNLVQGDLIVRDTGLALLFEMWGFETVEGGIYIENNPQLTTIANFISLTSVGTTIAVTDNPELIDVYGFDTLTETEASFSFQRNAKLQAVSFQSLTTAGREGIIASDVPALEDLLFPALHTLPALHIEHTGVIAFDHFASLTSLGGLTVSGNQALTTFNGSPLISVVDNLQFEGNAQLEEIQGFDALNQVNQSMVVTESPDLTTLSGLTQLTSIGTDAQLTNLGLTDLSGLENVDTIGGNLLILRNAQLPTADAEDFAAGLTSVGGTITIEGNL